MQSVEFSASDRFRILLMSIVTNRGNRAAVLSTLDELAYFRRRELESMEHKQARCAAYARSLADDVIANKTITMAQLDEAARLVLAANL